MILAANPHKLTNKYGKKKFIFYFKKGKKKKKGGNIEHPTFQ